ncbi:MAG: TRAM domain-containing protein, partial [Lawsonibacter sp.]
MADWEKNTVHLLEIAGYTSEGMGVARLDGRVVFVPGTIRGERWKVRLEKVSRTVAWGRGVELLTPSAERIASDCPLSGRCGGCQFRHMTYAEELAAKGQRVADALERMGGVHLELPPVLGAEEPARYRNKVQFPVAMEKQGLAVGYYRPRSHSVLNAEDCLLHPQAVTDLRRAFWQWMREYSIPAYEER